MTEISGPQRLKHLPPGLFWKKFARPGTLEERELGGRKSQEGGAGPGHPLQGSPGQQGAMATCQSNKAGAGGPNPDVVTMATTADDGSQHSAASTSGRSMCNPSFMPTTAKGGGD